MNNEHNHLKNLVNLGFLVDEKIKDSIESLNEEEFFKLIESLKKENVFMLNEEILKKFHAEDVKILRTAKKLEILSMQEFVKHLNERYAFLQSILMKKLELSNIVSINKADGNVTVIGLIKEMEDKNSYFLVSLEDPTGEIKATIDKKISGKIALDDVIAVMGNINNKILDVEKVLLPDVPLKPVIYSKEQIKIAFSSERKDIKADYLIYGNKIKDNIKNKEIELSNPCIFKIDDVMFLFIKGFDALDVLKKRYVNVENSDFFIEPPPDIVLTDKVNANYKGISIVSENKIINLKTREIVSI